MPEETKKTEDEANWLEITVAPSTPPDFRTHSNYVSFMKELSEELKITLNFSIDSRATFKKILLNKKLGLIKIIKENLDDEHKKSLQDRDFGKICSIWIPVKSYYLVFNLLLVLCSLINDDYRNLNYSHKDSIVNSRKLIKDGKISFNKHGFNRVFTCLEAESFKAKMGDNLRYGVEEESRIREIIKKICRYKFESYCRDEKVEEFRTKKNRIKRDEFFRKNEISLFEFFYWYRIKTNYRDLSFLDQDILSSEIVDFYENYYSLTINFYNALKDLINESSKKRFGEKIIL